MKTAFNSEIAKNIAARIKALKKDGTTGMSLLNLLMVTPTPRAREGAPAGPAGYKVMFREVAMSMPISRRFLITADY